MQTLTRRSTLAGGAALGAAALAGRAQAQALEKELVVYASHPSEMVDHFCNDFGQKNGVRVTTIKAGTGELLNRIRAERARPGRG